MNDINELLRILENAPQILENLNNTIANAQKDIARAQETIEKANQAKSKLEAILNPKDKDNSKEKKGLNFSGIQKAKSRFCQLGTAIKSRIPSFADIKEKLANAAISVGYVIESGANSIEKFTSDTIDKFRDRREPKENNEIESIVNTEKEPQKETQEESKKGGKLNFRQGIKQKASSAKTKLGSVSKKVLNEIKANTNIDVKIQQAFLKADISLTNTMYKIEDKVGDVKEGIRNIPSNLINKYREHKSKVAAEREARMMELEALKKQRENLKGQRNDNVYQMNPPEVSVEEESVGMRR